MSRRLRPRLQSANLPYRQLGGRRLVAWGHPTIVEILDRHGDQTITTDQAVDLINSVTQAGVQRRTVLQRSQELQRSSRDSPSDEPEGLEQQQPPEAPAFDPAEPQMSAECQAVYDILQNGSGNIPGMQQAPMLQQMMQQMQPSMPQPQLSSRPVAPPVNDSADRIVHRFLSALEDMEDLQRQQQENQLLVNQRMNQRIQQQRRLIQSYLESRMDGDGRQ